MPNLICEFCKQDCSGSFERVELVKFDKQDSTACKAVGEGIRCDPPCELALAAASALLKELEPRPGIADDLADLVWAPCEVTS